MEFGRVYRQFPFGDFRFVGQGGIGEVLFQFSPRMIFSNINPAAAAKIGSHNPMERFMGNQNLKDGRNVFVLPQSYEGGGYLAYGAPGGGTSQCAHPAMLTTLFAIASQWAAIESRKFGIGDIRLANGIRPPDHKTHRSGLEVDIRPLRRDGKQLPCMISEASMIELQHQN